MESRTLLQPMLRCIANSSSSNTARISAAAAPASRRHQSTTSRTKRALKIAPHPSFLGTPSTDAASSRVIYNPPSSSPSVYHTPFKFLPRSDPRRQANLTQLLRTSSDLLPSSSSSPFPSSSISTSASSEQQQQQQQLPPELKAPPQKYNVTREQVDEMRRLRAEDPEAWSVLRLAARYGCAPYFVMMCCRADREHRGRERARLDAIKARWGPIRAGAREERKKRSALLLKDAL